jgi:chromosome segregation ATPase
VQARIEEFQSQVSELEDQVRELQDNNKSLKDELAKLRLENETQAGEIADLRSRSTLSQSNWIKERDELISREAYAREEFENAKQAMQDWEVLAMNERSLRENLTEKDAELREQLESLREEYEKAARDRDTNGQSVDGLQKALQEVQTREFHLALEKMLMLTDISTETRAQKVRRNIRVTTQRTTQASTSSRRSIKSRKSNRRVHAKRARTSPPLRKGGQRKEPPHRQAPPRSRHSE